MPGLPRPISGLLKADAMEPNDLLVLQRGEEPMALPGKVLGKYVQDHGPEIDHSRLTNRDAPDAHPQESITGLKDDLQAIRDWVMDNFVGKDEAEGVMPSKVKVTFGANFEGQPYTITGGANESYTGTVPASLTVEQAIKTLNTTYTVTCASEDGTSYGCDIIVGNFYGIYPGEIYSFRAFIACTADVGALIRAVCGERTYTGMADSNGAYTFTVGAAGTYSLTAALGGKTTSPVTVDVTTAEETYACKLPSLIVTVVPWATGTDEEIAAMVAALDDGTLSIKGTGWAVGDERKVSLSAMATSSLGDSHVAQTVTMVLMDSQHYDLATPTAGGSTKDHFVVGLKNSLKNDSYMNHNNTNVGGWDKCKRRAWCNNIFRAAIPEPLRGCFKQFNVMAANSATKGKISVDYFALFGSCEILGSTENPGENTGTSQIEWYKTAANRIKKLGDTGSANRWWERSIRITCDTDFKCIDSKGSTYSYGAGNYACGLAPFGCI